MFSKPSLIFTLALSLVVVGTSWLSLRSSLPSSQSDHPATDKIGIAQNIEVIQMNPDGFPNYQASATNITQYADNHNTLNGIQTQLFNNQELPPWMLFADSAITYDNNQVIQLIGNVIFERAQAAQARPLRFTTSEITLYPQKNSAHTTQPIAITEPGTDNVTQAVGMEAHLDPTVIHLLSQVKSTYEMATFNSSAS